MQVNSVVTKLFCKCYQNGAINFILKQTEKLSYSNEYGKTRQWCKSSTIKLRAFKQPSKNVGCAQPYRVFSDVI